MTEKYILNSPYGHLMVGGSIKIKNGEELCQREKIDGTNMDNSSFWWSRFGDYNLRFRVPIHWIEVRKFV